MMLTSVTSGDTSLRLLSFSQNYNRIAQVAYDLALQLHTIREIRFSKANGSRHQDVLLVCPLKSERQTSFRHVLVPVLVEAT